MRSSVTDRRSSRRRRASACRAAIAGAALGLLVIAGGAAAGERAGALALGRTGPMVAAGHAPAPHGAPHFMPHGRIAPRPAFPRGRFHGHVRGNFGAFVFAPVPLFPLAEPFPYAPPYPYAPYQPYPYPYNSGFTPSYDSGFAPSYDPRCDPASPDYDPSSCEGDVYP